MKWNCEILTGAAAAQRSDRESYIGGVVERGLIRLTYSAVEEVFRSFASVKVQTPHCENTPLQVRIQNLTSSRSVSTSYLMFLD